MQRAVLAEADLGLVLARARLDVDVRSALAVGIDDDLVDQLDQFVVGRRREIIVRTRRRSPRPLVSMSDSRSPTVAVIGMVAP
jgi:hypothetical protein